MPKLLIILFYLLPAYVYAHQPVLNIEGDFSPDTPYIIDKPEISKAIFSSLQGTPHYYQITSDAVFRFYAGITVPKLDDCEDFERFSFSVLDSDMKSIGDYDGEAYEWWPWYEEYGKKWYWIGPEYGKDFKSINNFAAGTYYIKVYNAENKGNYVLAVGDEEKFTPMVMMKMLFTLPKINRIFWNRSNCSDPVDSE